MRNVFSERSNLSAANNSTADLASVNWQLVITYFGISLSFALCLCILCYCRYRANSIKNDDESGITADARFLVAGHVNEIIVDPCPPSAEAEAMYYSRSVL